MIDHAAPSFALAPAGRHRRLAPVLIACAAATVLLGLLPRYGALSAQRAAAQADVLALMALTVWIALAAGPLAAGAEDALAALLRTAILADAGAIALLVIALTGPVVTWSLAWRLYLLWLGFCLAAAGVVRLAKTPLSRGAAAMALSAASFLGCASLLWSAGLVLHLPGPWQYRVAAAAAAINPLQSLSLLLRPIGFFWSEQPVMYHLARVGQDYPAPAVGWQVCALLWWALAAAAWSTAGLRCAWRAFWWGN